MLSLVSLKTMQPLIVAGFILILLLLLVMLGKRNKMRADWFLILYLTFSLFGQVYSFVEQSEWMQRSYWMLLGRGLYLLYTPFFFLYVWALIHDGGIPRWLNLVLFGPFVIYVIHFLYFYGWIFTVVDPRTIEIKNGMLYIERAAPWSWVLFVALFLIIEPFYLVWFYNMFRNYERRVLSSVSNIDKIHLNWIKILFSIRGFTAIFLVPVSLMAVGSGFVTMQFLQVTIEAVSLIFFFLLGYYGFNQTTVFTNVVDQSVQEREHPSYERSGLTEESAIEIHEKLVAVMVRDKPYLNGELSAKQLSSMAGISTNHLSEILSKVQHQNFFDFVNSYRVKEVKTRIKNPQFAHYTLLAIALDSGFNSKTSFNTVFKRFTGKTPSEYAKQKRQGRDAEYVNRDR
jgi:AraC-like DNA-binding protein